MEFKILTMSKVGKVLTTKSMSHCFMHQAYTRQDSKSNNIVIATSNDFYLCFNKSLAIKKSNTPKIKISENIFYNIFLVLFI